MNKNDWKLVKDKEWEAYAEKERNNPERIKEVNEKVMYYGDVKMKYGVSVIGNPDANGYPLYIAMHGGGQDPDGHTNEAQWEHMGIYYKNSVKNGVYVNVRACRDTWDCHGNPESFVFYDRLIENMILFANVDPNRVYMLGFSAGGDGVYITSPRMADRLAATHMSAGHHNGTSVFNLRNTPIQLQVGAKDFAYNRHQVTVEYQIKLDGYSAKYGGYEHNCFVHVDKPHNFYDNAGDKLQTVIADNYKWLEDETVTTKEADTDAIHFLDRYVRKPLPERVVWDLTNRGTLRKVTSFYWLAAPMDETEGFVVADIDKANNAIVFDKETTAKKLTILLNDDMLDPDKPISVVFGDKKNAYVLERSEDVLKQTIAERGDCNYAFTCKLDIEL